MKLLAIHSSPGTASARTTIYLCSLLAIAGGLLGYYTLDRASGLIPYVLVFASSGFIYIAVSDLMPQMQRRATLRETEKLRKQTELGK